MADDDSVHVDGDNKMPAVVDGWPRYPSVLQRYYTTFTTSNHQSVHVHSNGLSVLGISRSHPLIQPPWRVTDVAFRSHDSKNLLKAEVTGKKKSGAHFMSEHDMIATVTVSDDAQEPPATQTFKLYSCIRGSVIEVNRRLIGEPGLLGAEPDGAGFLCVMLPKIDEKKAIGEALLAFDAEGVLGKTGANEKRRLEGKSVRTHSNKKQKRECWDFFKRGKCKWGDECRYSHQSPEEQIAERKAKAAAAAAVTAPGVGSAVGEGAGAASGDAAGDLGGAGAAARADDECVQTAATSPRSGEANGMGGSDAAAAGTPATAELDL